jgi:hypothetical protein
MKKGIFAIRGAIRIVVVDVEDTMVPPLIYVTIGDRYSDPKTKVRGIFSILDYVLHK